MAITSSHQLMLTKESPPWWEPMGLISNPLFLVIFVSAVCWQFVQETYKWFPTCPWGAAAISLVVRWAAAWRVERSILHWGNVSSQLHLISPGCPRPNSALIVQKRGLKHRSSIHPTCPWFFWHHIYFSFRKLQKPNMKFKQNVPVCKHPFIQRAIWG